MLNCKYLACFFLLLLGVQNIFAQAPQWVQMNPPPGTQAGGLVTCQTRLFMLTESELFFTDNDGISWTKENDLHSQYRPFKMFKCDTTLFIQHSSGYFLDKSTNGGKSWDSVIGYGDYFYSDNKGLFYTRDLKDLNFVSLDGTIQFEINRNALGVITRFITAKENYILYLTDSVWGYGRIYTISADLGKTWHNFHYPGEGEQIHIVGDIFFTSGNEGIYRSTDTCQTWTLIDSTVRKASYFLGDQNIIFVFSHSLGVLYSPDHGFTWKQMNEGLPNFRFTHFVSSTNELYVSLETGEFYHTSFPATVKSDRPIKGSCSIYPNPLVTEGSISYSLPIHSSVSLMIYDALGRIVSTPISEQNQDAGEHTLSFNAKALTSGFYYCRLHGASEKIVSFIKQ